MKTKKYLAPLLLVSLILTLASFSCEKKKEVLSNENEIKFFIFGTERQTPDKNDIIRFSRTKSDSATFTHIAPSDIEISEGARIDPAKDSALNFTKPVIYHVVAQDMRNARKYTVIVTFDKTVAE